MIDLSFYKRGDLARNPILIKPASEIWKRGQSAATLALVALAAFTITLLIWGAK